MGYTYVIYSYILFTTIQEECLKCLDNKPSQPKIKRKNVNPYGEIVNLGCSIWKGFWKYPNVGTTKIEKC